MKAFWGFTSIWLLFFKLFGNTGQQSNSSCQIYRKWFICLAWYNLSPCLVLFLLQKMCFWPELEVLSHLCDGLQLPSYPWLSLQGNLTICHIYNNKVAWPGIWVGVWWGWCQPITSIQIVLTIRKPNHELSTMQMRSIFGSHWGMLKAPPLISSDLRFSVIKCHCWTYDDNIGPKFKKADLCYVGGA